MAAPCTQLEPQTQHFHMKALASHLHLVVVHSHPKDRSTPQELHNNSQNLGQGESIHQFHKQESMQFKACVLFTWVEPTFIQQNTHIASPTPTTISKCDIGIDISATPSTPHDTCTHKVNHRNLLLQYTRAQCLQFNCLIYIKLLKPGSTEGYYYQHQCASYSHIQSENY